MPNGNSESHRKMYKALVTRVKIESEIEHRPVATNAA